MLIDIHVLTERYSEHRILPVGSVKNAMRKGLDGIVLVEHNRLWTDEDIEMLRREADAGDFLLLRGQQVQCPDGDVLVIGCDEELSNQTAAMELTYHVRQSGGCCILIPETSEISRLSKFFVSSAHKNVTLSLFDAVEIFNSLLSKQDMRSYLELRRKRSFCAVAGSASTQTPLYATKFFYEIKNEKDLAKAIIDKKAYPCPVDGFSVDSRGGKFSAIEWNIPRCYMMRLKGLVFDLYGTLVDLKSRETHEEFNRMAMWLSQENIQVSGDTLMHFYHQRCREMYDNARKSVKFPEVDILRVFRDAISLFSGWRCSEEYARKAALVFRTLTIKSIKLYPHTRRILRELKRRGYVMGVISNAQSAFTLPEIEDLKLGQFFDFIILSSDVGCSKPDTGIYEIASRQLEFPPSSTAFIGDDLYGDIFGAWQHGYKTVFVKTNVGNMTSPVDIEPDVALLDGDLRNLLRVFP